MFFDVVTWRGMATNASKFLKKGSKVFISGSLEQDSWEKDGVKHTKVVINADTVDFLDPAPKTKEVEQEDSPAEEIPF